MRTYKRLNTLQKFGGGEDSYLGRLKCCSRCRLLACSPGLDRYSRDPTNCRLGCQRKKGLWRLLSPFVSTFTFCATAKAVVVVGASRSVYNSCVTRWFYWARISAVYS